MKKSIIIIFLVLAITKANAQNYLISFAGTGDTTVVSTVKVDNLASGATINLSGGDVLHLVPIVGISNLDNNKGTLQIYPNPMAEQSILIVEAPENGNAVLSILDLSGKTVCQINTFLSYGTNSFRVSVINRGMYLVKVNAENYTYSTKLICQNNQQGEATIESIPAVENTTGNHLKSSKAYVDMQYTDGDQLLFKGISGIYSTIVPDIPSSNETITFNFHDCTDGDNNNYAIVQIGDQIWMAENLKVGVRINGIQEQTDNGIIEKYCYNNDDSLCAIYGGLYQWNETMQYVTNVGVQGICPSGWHIPGAGEWVILTNYLGGEGIAGGKLKETGTSHWYGQNIDATNESGFTALPGGGRGSSGGFPINSIGNFGYWWSSNQGSPSDVWCWSMYCNDDDVFSGRYYKVYGNSVRCVRDF